MASKSTGSQLRAVSRGSRVINFDPSNPSVVHSTTPLCDIPKAYYTANISVGLRLQHAYPAIDKQRIEESYDIRARTLHQELLTAGYNPTAVIGCHRWNNPAYFMHFNMGALAELYCQLKDIFEPSTSSAAQPTLSTSSLLEWCKAETSNLNKFVEARKAGEEEEQNTVDSGAVFRSKR